MIHLNLTVGAYNYIPGQYMVPLHVYGCSLSLPQCLDTVLKKKNQVPARINIYDCHKMSSI